MKILAAVVVGALMLLVGFPLSLIVMLTAVAAPASQQSLCVAPAPSASGTGTDGIAVLAAPGSPRYGSLNNPPVPIPPDIERLYTTAGARYGLPWTLLAGIGMEETNHGTNTKSDAHGVGLMQFLPSTWTEYGVDGDGDGHADIGNDIDSIYSAANYLAALDARAGGDAVIQALHIYNPNTWYANDVLYYAAAYAGEDVASSPCVTGDTGTASATVIGTGPAIDAVNAAMRWIGTRYSWGGGSESGPTTGICCSPGGQDARNVVGFDCSGLVLYAYAQIVVPPET